MPMSTHSLLLDQLNLKVTNEHPMLVFKDNVFKFVEISDLLVGDFLVREDGTLEEVFAKPKVTVNCITHTIWM